MQVPTVFYGRYVRALCSFKKKKLGQQIQGPLSTIELLVTFLDLCMTFGWCCLWTTFIPALLSVCSFVKPPRFFNIRQI